MDIDLMMERNLQLFMRLAGLPEINVVPLMCWRISQREIFLEHRSGRLHISYCIPAVCHDDTLLYSGLSSWHPARFAGVPQRLYRLRHGMVISCAAPVGSNAEFWLLLHQKQKGFLEALCVQR